MAIVVTLTAYGCSEEPADNLQPVETLYQSESSPEPAGSTAVPQGTAPGGGTDAGSEELPFKLSTSDSGITLTGTGLARNTILQQVIALEGAEWDGVLPPERTVDVAIVDGSIEAVLGALLPGVDYQVRMESRAGARNRLSALWLGEGPVQVSQLPAGASSLESPLLPDGVLAGTREDHVRMLAERYASGDPEEQASAIMDTELTEGGISFIAEILNTAQDEAILLEALSRLDASDEFAARWLLLQLLGHPNRLVVLEALDAIEVWQDISIGKYLEPLVNHHDSAVREKALELLDDLASYTEVGLAGDPYNLESSGGTLTPEQLMQIEKTTQALKQGQPDLGGPRLPGAPPLPAPTAPVSERSGDGASNQPSR